MTQKPTQPFLGLPGGDIILASASVTRQNILTAAGLDFRILPASVDEPAVRAAAHADSMTADEIAVLLAELKANAAFQALPTVMPDVAAPYILGCDQILVFDEKVISKPESLSAAKDQLYALAGHQHKLLTAIVLTRNGQRIWHHLGTAALTMRRMDKPFIDAYVRYLGPAALASPGGYQIEGIGASLFSLIDGDHFDILGLPLMPLLAILREHGLAPIAAAI